jgi:hypothetical protein
LESQVLFAVKDHSLHGPVRELELVRHGCWRLSGSGNTLDDKYEDEGSLRLGGRFEEELQKSVD